MTRNQQSTRKQKETQTPCRTHIFLTHCLCVAYRHRAHAWLKVFAVRMSRLPVSRSPFSCFIRRPCRFRTATSTSRSCLHLPCPIVPDPKARVKRTSARAAGSWQMCGLSQQQQAESRHDFDPRRNPETVHTLTCCTHIFLRTGRALRTSAPFSCVSHRRTTQVREKGVLSHECLCSLSRLLPSHVSPVSAVLVRLP